MADEVQKPGDETTERGKRWSPDTKKGPPRGSLCDFRRFENQPFGPEPLEPEDLLLPEEPDLEEELLFLPDLSLLSDFEAL